MARVSYQVAGERRHRVGAVVDRAVVPDPRAWLEARLGPLVHFEVIEPAPPAAEAPAEAAPARQGGASGASDVPGWGAGALSPPARPLAGPLPHAGAAWGAAP